MTKKQVIIVLSGGITHGGKVPFFVKIRLDEAYQCFHHGVSSRIILSGLCSYLYEDHPPCTEASAMATYLKLLGVPEKNIYLEEKSFDLVSSIYYLKKQYLIPRRLHNILVIASDFQEERVRYVLEKVLGNTYSINYIFKHSRLKPTLLWEFFIYEKKTLLKTKAYLRNMKKGDHSFLKRKFFDGPFYKKKHPGRIRMLVPEGRIGKPTSVKALYSLRNIYKKRLEIFEKYGLREGKLLKSSEADFWSGRFLNFVGKENSKAYYALKFALQPKDKKNFSREIKITEFLKKKGVTFIPTVVDANFGKAPIWYLYKIVAGRIAGYFSISYSFGEHFYKGFAAKTLMRHLKKLRNIKSGKFHLPSWRSGVYKKYFDRYYKKARQYKRISSSKTVRQARDFFYNNTSIFGWTSLYVSHNDLHPANIIIAPVQQKLYFIDFEHVGLNNIAFDFCFAHIFSWDNPQFQKKLRAEFLRTLSKREAEEFEVVFPTVYCFFLVWFLNFIEVWKDRAGKERYTDARKYVFSELKRLVK